MRNQRTVSRRTHPSRRSTLKLLGGGVAAGGISLAGCMGNDANVEPKVTESWVSYREDTTADVALLLESESKRLTNAIEKSDDYEWANPDEFEVVPTESDQKWKTKNAPIPYLPTPITNLEYEGELYVFNTRDTDTVTNRISEYLQTVSMNRFPMVDSLNFASGATAHVRFFDGVRYLFPGDEIEAEKSLPSYPFDYRHSDSYQTVDSDSELHDSALDLSELRYPYNTIGKSNPIPEFEHYLTKNFLGAFRTISHVKKRYAESIVQILDLNAKLNRGYKNVEKGVEETINALPGPSADSLYIDGNAAVRFLAMTTKAVPAALAVESVIGVIRGMQKAVAAFRKGFKQLSDSLDLAEYSLVFREFVPMKAFDGDHPKWPTTVDLQQLLEHENRRFARTIGFVQMSAQSRTDYLQLLDEQRTVVTKLLSKEITIAAESTTTLELTAQGIGPAGLTPNQIAVEYANYLIESLNGIQKLTELQIDALKKFNSMVVENTATPPPTSTPTPTRTPTSSPTPAPTATTTSVSPSTPTPTSAPDSSAPSASASLPDGRNFSIEPERNEGTFSQLVVEHHKGTESYSIDRFRLVLNNTNADGTYRLTRVTTDRRFAPGDRYLVDARKLGRDVPLDYGGGEATLEINTKNGWSELVEASFPSDLSH